MAVIFFLLTLLFFCSTCLLGHLCLEAQRQRNLYYTRWLEANRLLHGDTAIERIAEGEPVVTPKPQITQWAGVEKGTHTQLTQKRLNQMSDFNRFQIEKARLKEGLAPVDNMDGMNDYWTQEMIKLRAKEGWH